MPAQVRVASALSEHPLATHAVGESVGQLLDAGGPSPDLVVIAVTGPHIGALEDIVRAVRRLLQPAVLVGATAESVLAGAREVEGQAALTLFALWNGPVPVSGGITLEDVPRPVVSPIVTGLRLVTTPGAEGLQVHRSGPGGAAGLGGAAGTLVLLADPFSTPVEDVLDELRRVAPDLSVIGGMASAGRHPGGNRVVLDGLLHRDHMVAALIAPEVAVTTLVSQGCRPIGTPLTVTRGERHVIGELAGRPALERLMELVDTLPPAERVLAANGLHLGRVIDEHHLELGRGDFLIRNVLGADHDTGAIAVGGEVEIGSTVQFHLRDADSAHEDLTELMGDHAGGAGALVFTCTGRGTRLFGEAGHDATVISDALDGAPVAGMFCAGELGPIGGSSFAHSLSASVLLFE